MSEAKMGATKKEVKPAGSFNMRWVSVFGAYVPEKWAVNVLWTLEMAGYEAKILGHTIQVRYDDADPNRVDDVRELIRDYAANAWARPATAKEMTPYLILAELAMSRTEAEQ